MKNCTKLFLGVAAMFAFGNGAFAQSKMDFETVAQDWSWTLFNNATNLPTLYSVVANPDATGINTSPNCAKYIVNAAGDPWAGLWSDNIGSFTFSSANCKIKVMVNKNVISKFLVKFENGGDTFELLVPNTKINEWEELTFDFSSKIGKTYTRVVIIPDFPSTRTAGSTNYWDNISFNSNVVTSLDNIKSESVSVYPNPVSGVLNIKAGQIISNLTISNILGQPVKSVAVNSIEATLSLSDLSAGQYFITITQADGAISTQKIVKQ